MCSLGASPAAAAAPLRTLTHGRHRHAGAALLLCMPLLHIGDTVPCSNPWCRPCSHLTAALHTTATPSPPEQVLHEAGVTRLQQKEQELGELTKKLSVAQKEVSKGRTRL